MNGSKIRNMTDNQPVEKTIQHNLETVLVLNESEYMKCRYQFDQKTRKATCVVHTQNCEHGVVLHPPHLWDIVDDGILMFKKNNKWHRYIPQNKERLIDKI